MDTEQYIQKLFDDSGWYKGRSTKVQNNVLDLFKPAYKNALKIIKEYGGLTVGEVGPGRDLSASEICFYSKTFDLGKEFNHYWSGNISSLFSVASAHRDHMQIVVDENNNFYIFTDPDEKLYFGGSFQYTVNKVLLGLNYGNAVDKT
jgi:hypothetical protein